MLHGVVVQLKTTFCLSKIAITKIMVSHTSEAGVVPDLSFRQDEISHLEESEMPLIINKLNLVC